MSGERRVQGVLVRVVTPHQAVPALWNDYHQWVQVGRFKGDSLGRHNPRMIESKWTKWVCNNGDCGGWAVVSDALVAALIDTYAEHR